VGDAATLFYEESMRMTQRKANAGANVSLWILGLLWADLPTSTRCRSFDTIAGKHVLGAPNIRDIGVGPVGGV
jgi:hypothetical protein